MMCNSDALDRFDLSSLRVMFTGGEAVPYARAEEFEQRTGCRILQFYGSNETGLLSGTTIDDPPERRLATAGRVVADMHVRLFDGDRDVTASGYGQPACRGPATSVGYLDDPAGNAELFTADGWMRMGDLCRIDADGYLTVVGRTSDVIIRGGKNISAAEVEAEVATHDGRRARRPRSRCATRSSVSGSASTCSCGPGTRSTSTHWWSTCSHGVSARNCSPSG